MVLNNISYYYIFSLPLVAWIGLAALILMISTASMPALGKKGIIQQHFKWHIRLAVAAIIIGIIHASLIILANI